jgi:hypothetical protein
MKSEGFYVMYPWKLTNFPACPYLLPNAWDYRTDKNHRRFGGDTQVWISLGCPLFLHRFQGHRQTEPPCLDLSRSRPALCSVWPSVTFFSTGTIKHGARYLAPIRFSRAVSEGDPCLHHHGCTRRVPQQTQHTHLCAKRHSESASLYH